MKMRLQFVPVLLGLCAVGCCGVGRCGVGHAQEKPVQTAQVGAPVARTGFDKLSFSDQVLFSSVIMNGSYTPRPDIAALEPRLKEAILGVLPEAHFETGVDSLYVTYRSAKYDTHLLDSSGLVSKEGADKFPGDFSEFCLRVSVSHDSRFYRPENVPEIKAEGFGTTVRARTNLRLLAKNTDQEQIGRWSSLAYDHLAKAGLVESRVPAGATTDTPRRLTRSEFAEAVVRLHARTPAPTLNRDLSASLGNLEWEFAPEIYALESKPVMPMVNGMKWQAPDEYLSMEFSYGKGMKPELAEKIMHVVAHYGAEKMNDDTIERAATAQK